MKIFNPLYEVYHRNDKTIISQGTYSECKEYMTKNWFYSMRLSKEELYAKDEVLELCKSAFNDGEYRGFLLKGRNERSSYDETRIPILDEWLKEKLFNNIL